MKLPPRKLLRGVLSDAINDREGFLDANRPRHGEPDDKTKALIDKTHEQIAQYKEVEARLDSPQQLNDRDLNIIAMATHHARIWRSTLVDSWKDTGDKQNIRLCREDMERLKKVERALGLTPHFIVGGPDPKGATMVTVAELMRRYDSEKIQ